MYNAAAHLDLDEQYDKIHTTHDGIVTGPLSPKSFRTPESAQMFVNSLQTQTGCWQYLASQCNAPFTGLSAQHSSTEQQVSQLLLSGQVKLYPITLPKLTDSSPKRRTIKGGDRVNYQFTPVANMLITKAREVKKFHDKASADAFLAELNPDEEQLKSLATELDIPISSTASINPAELTDSITTAMASGEVVIIVDRISGAPPGEQQAEENNSVGNRPIADEGTDGSGAEKNEQQSKQEQDKKPLCKRNTFTVKCSHGRSVELTPEVKHMPTLSIVSTTKNIFDNKKNQLLDYIVVESDITDICSTHTTAHMKITCNKGEKVKQVINGKKVMFNAPSDKQSIRANFLEYLWLDNVKPRSFTLCPVACDQTKLDSAGSGVVVDVYPHIEMQAKVQLGLGSGSAKIVDDKDNKGQLKKELSQKKFSLSGSVLLKQEDNKFELTSEFQDTIKDSISQLESIANTVEGILGKFDEGRKPSVEITWPNFALELTTSITEKAKSPDKTISFVFKAKADPFVKLEAQVDILPVLMSPLLGGIVGKHIIENLLADLDNGWGSEEGWAHIRANAQILMKAKGELKGEFSLEGSDKKVATVTGKPVEAGFEFEARGEIKVDGHLLKVKIEIVAGIGIKSSIDIGLQFKDDKTGCYWQPTCMFNGVKVYIEGSVKVEKNTAGKDESSSARNPLANNTSAKSQPNEHIWIEPAELETEKRYFVRY